MIYTHPNDPYPDLITSGQLWCVVYALLRDRLVICHQERMRRKR